MHRSEQPVTLEAQKTGYQGLWEQRDGASSPQFTPKDQLHEGRLLQLIPNASDAFLNASAQTVSTNALSDRYKTSSSSQNASATTSHSVSQEAHRQHPDTASSVNSLVSSKDMLASNAEDRNAVGTSGGNSSLSLFGPPQTMADSVHNVTDQSSYAILQYINHSTSTETDHTSSHALSHSGVPVSSGDSSPSADVEACPPHLDLPIPGMDIAPANQSKCYSHPAEYINNKYLNDNNYMLYHHDHLPTTNPHPAFTWGDISRFSHAMHKMKRKDPVKAVFVGGSVSSSYCRYGTLNLLN